MRPRARQSEATARHQRGSPSRYGEADSRRLRVHPSMNRFIKARLRHRNSVNASSQVETGIAVAAPPDDAQDISPARTTTSSEGSRFSQIE